MKAKILKLFSFNQDTNNIQEILKLCTQGKFNWKENPVYKETVCFEMSSLISTGVVLKDKTVSSASSGDSILKSVSFS
jgi:hypothetical protein